MNKIIVSVCFLSVLVGCAKKEDTSMLAARVNGKDITRSEVTKASEMLFQGIVQMYPQKAVEGISPAVTKAAVKQLIANILLLDEATKRGIKADSAEAESTFNMIAKQMGDQAALERQLTSMGETVSSMKKQIRESVILKQLVQQLLSKADSVDENECKAFYEKNKGLFKDKPRIRLSQLLIAVDTAGQKGSKPEKALETAQKAITEAKSGADFNKLAKTYSTRAFVSLAGDIGWFGRGDLKPELEQAASSLKMDEVSGVVQSDIGFHVIKKTGEESGKEMPFETVKDRIRMSLELQNRNKLMVSLVDSLISKAQVKYYDTTFQPSANASDSALFGDVPQ